MSKWRQLAIDSHYQTAIAIRNELEAARLESAKEGIEELIEALSRSDKRALKTGFEKSNDSTNDAHHKMENTARQTHAELGLLHLYSIVSSSGIGRQLWWANICPPSGVGANVSL